ncbi:hemoglobin [Kushneria sinocarnis]|uniref:Group 1 truncated hemoglobin n=1 Tax=Kushneria sinocarnis TaxID=595502 RepID=A0A420X1R3_9GAMM|nr:group 1 truncated hemoglobin [Kushneria sinocarnis]RKR07677.1 hemoglobin [Kushneria sinocarnis]
MARACYWLMVLLLLSGCGSQAASPSLYRQLGGQPGVEAIVHDFLIRMADDARLVGFFAHTNIDHLADSLGDQLCEVSGGPCHYQGPPMDRVHQHMGLTDDDFYAMIGHLNKALMAQGVPAGARQRVIGIHLAAHEDVMRLARPAH